MLLVLLPLVEEGLVCQLVVKAHCTEARALKEEIEVLIVVSVALFGAFTNALAYLFLGLFFDDGNRIRLAIKVERYQLGALSRLLAFNS